MNLFAGLYFYEIVLLLLGVALFLALLVALLRNVFKDKPYAALLPGFFIPIVMIGYPSIESIQYQNGIVEIQKATNAVQENPSDPQAQAQLNELQAKVSKIEPRAGNDPHATQILAMARKAIARAPVEKGKPSTQDGNLSEAQLQKKAALLKDAEELTATVQNSPNNQPARNQLASVVNEIRNIGKLDANDTATIERAERALQTR